MNQPKRFDAVVSTMVFAGLLASGMEPARAVPIAPDLSTPLAAATTYWNAESLGDSVALRASTTFTSAWEKVVAALLKRGGAEVSMRKAIADRWRQPAVEQFTYLQAHRQFPDDVVKITGDTATLGSAKYPDMPRSACFKRVNGQWKVDLFADARPGDEADREAWFNTQTKINADFTKRIVQGTYKTAKEAAKLHGEIISDLYGSRGTDPVSIVTMADRYYFGFAVEKDRAAALPLYRRAADAGNARAMASLGNYYEYGYEVPEDSAAAMGWYLKSAKAGNARVGRDIGGLYEHGTGVSQDYGLALLWYRKAANDGSAFATEKVGEIYETGGHGVLQDDAQAVEWFKKAVALKDTDAMRHLAQMSERGAGVPKDHADALRWYQMAADAGDEKSKKWLAEHPK